MKAFATAAQITVTLTRPGLDAVPVLMQAPPFGWWRRFSEVFPAPTLTQRTRKGKGWEVTTVPDEAGAKAYAHQLALLLAGKVISEAGGLDRTYPDPLPSDRDALVRLSQEIEAEFRAAHLRGAEVDRLATAAFRLVMGELPDLDQARESGNGSPLDGAL